MIPTIMHVGVREAIRGGCLRARRRADGEGPTDQERTDNHESHSITIFLCSIIFTSFFDQVRKPSRGSSHQGENTCPQSRGGWRCEIRESTIDA